MIAKPERPARPARRAKRLALEASRAQGCVCMPVVRVTVIDGDVAHVGVGHDSWCPLLRVKTEGRGLAQADLLLAPNGSISGEGAE